MKGLRLSEAAKALGIHRTTLRRMIAAGCPTVKPGDVGRGRGAILDLAEVERWRARKTNAALVTRDDERMLGLIAESFLDVLKRDRAFLDVGIAEGQAAGFLFLVFERVWMNVTRRSRDEIVLPPQMKHQRSIWLEWTEQTNFTRR